MLASKSFTFLKRKKLTPITYIIFNFLSCLAGCQSFRHFLKIAFFLNKKILSWLAGSLFDNLLNF